MKKTILLFAVLLLSLTACTAKKEVSEQIAYNDGEYTAESSKDEWGGKLILHIKVQDGKIISCEQENLDGEGKEKGEDYGMVEGTATNPGLYKIAQSALENTRKYSDKLIETQDINRVDAISGATVSYNLFKEAASKALEEAEK